MAPPSLPPGVLAGIVVAVTVVWSAAVLASIITRDVQPAAIATPVMGAVLGWVSGVRVWRNGEKNGR